MVDKQDAFDIHQSLRIEQIMARVARTDETIRSLESQIVESQERTRLRQESIHQLRNEIFRMGKGIELVESSEDRAVQYVFLRVHRDRIAQTLETALSRLETFQDKEYVDGIKTRLLDLNRIVEGEIESGDRALYDEFLSNREYSHRAKSKARAEIERLTRRKDEVSASGSTGCLSTFGLIVCCAAVIIGVVLESVSGLWLIVPGSVLALVILVRMDWKGRKARHKITDVDFDIGRIESDIEVFSAKDKRASETFWIEFAHLHPEARKIETSLGIRPADES